MHQVIKQHFKVKFWNWDPMTSWQNMTGVQFCFSLKNHSTLLPNQHLVVRHQHFCRTEISFFFSLKQAKTSGGKDIWGSTRFFNRKKCNLSTSSCLSLYRVCLRSPKIVKLWKINKSVATKKFHGQYFKELWTNILLWDFFFFGGGSSAIF